MRRQSDASKKRVRAQSVQILGTPPRAVTPAKTVRKHELNPDNVADAAVELLRMAAEWEQRQRGYPDVVAEARYSDATFEQLVSTEATLQHVVDLVLECRDRRRKRIEEIRVAQIVLEVDSFIDGKRKAWREQNDKRKRDGLSGKTFLQSAKSREELANFIQSCAERWDFVRTDAQIGQLGKLVELIADPSPGRSENGRIWQIAQAMYQTGFSSVAARTVQGLCGTLEGRSQSQGWIKRPEDAVLALQFDPMGLGYIVDYLVQHAYRGIPSPGVRKMLSGNDPKWWRELIASWLVPKDRPARTDPAPMDLAGKS